MQNLGRKPLRYILLDLPSDHEIEGALATECDVLYAMLANHELAAVTKRIRIGRPETLRQLRLGTSGAEFVHIAGHATADGLWMLGDVVAWSHVAKALANCVSPLKPSRERLVHFSCCHSQRAAKLCRRHLSPYFSGAYHFVDQTVPYATAIAVWTMFFHQQPSTRNHWDIVRRINTFIGQEVLRFVPYLEPMSRDIAAIKEMEALRA